MPKIKNAPSTYKRILAYLKRDIILLILSGLFALISVVGTLYLPILTGRAVDAMLLPLSIDYEVIFRTLRIGGIVILVTMFSQWMMNLLNNRITASVVCRIRRDALHTLERVSVSYMDSHPHGDIVSRTISDVDTFSDGLLLGFSQLFTGIMSIALTLAFMLFLDVRIAIMVVILTPLSLFCATIISKKTYKLFRKQADMNGELTAFIEENIENEKLVQAFSMEGTQEAVFEQMNENYRKASLKATFLSSLTNPCTRFVNAIVYAVVAVAGAFFILNDETMSIGQLSCFLTYANQYTKPFNEISGVIAEFQNAMACAQRIFALIDELPENMQVTAQLKEPVRGDVSVENVYFSYDINKPLITDFNLLVQAGQRIAIVGPTGCGKTTLINLLMRFYETNRGHIFIDQTDIASISKKNLRNCFGMVLQDTWLKQGTIRENIAFGKEDATDEEIEHVARAAHAYNFISKLPKGYETMLTEDGGNLSPGQKQLLCIARVMLLQPEMLILDEATSSIDTRTEQKIQDAFEKLMKDKTSFIVAHRLQTIKNADCILVMRDGSVIEQGTHEQLLAKRGFYSKLVAAGSSENVPEM